MHAGTGGPHDEVQRGPCTLNGQGRCRRRGAKLAARFLLKKFDLHAINRKTLAATPYLVYPSYIQVLLAGMAALAWAVREMVVEAVRAVVPEEGDSQLVVAEDMQAVVVVLAVGDKAMAGVQLQLLR